jgi:hypothetical protein
MPNLTDNNTRSIKEIIMKYLIRIALIISTVSLIPFTVAADPLADFKDGETLTAEALNKLVQRINALEKTYVIGDTGPAGGIVFYITELGHYGLEAAPADQSVPFNPGAAWGCFGTDITGADGTAIGTGAQNTADILADCVDLGIAARLADDFTLNGYNDWFLPSKDELNELYINSAVVGGFASNFYWGSSEVNANDAWGQFFGFGVQANGFKFNTSYGVRAVRAF